MTRKKPSLLFLTQQVPAVLTDGGNIRTFHVLKALSCDFGITVVASVRDWSHPPPLPHLDSLCTSILLVPDVKRPFSPHTLQAAIGSFRSRTPLPLRYNFNHHILSAVRRLRSSDQFSAIHLNHVDAAQYLPALPPDRCTIDTHNLLHDFYARAGASSANPVWSLLMKRWARTLQTYELACFGKVRHILVCSEKERDRLVTLGCDCPTSVVPNGVDCDYFSNGDVDYSRNRPVVIFVGHMGYWPNADAAIYFIAHVLPLLRRRVPGIRFLVVGKDPPVSLRRLSRRHEDVEVTGEVPDIRPYVKTSRILVVPLRNGAGTRLKVLEAFAMGIPTVSTRVGAEGIDCEHGEHLLIADTPQAFCESIVRLLNDDELHHRLSRQSRRLAQQKYDWRVIGEKVAETYALLFLADRPRP